MQHTVVQVDVAPAQPDHLALTQATQRGEVERRVQPVVADAGQELRQLGRRPHRHRRADAERFPGRHYIRSPDHCGRPAGPREPHLPGRIGADKSFPPAAFRDADSAAWIRCKVAADSGRPDTPPALMIARNIVATA